MKSKSQDDVTVQRPIQSTDYAAMVAEAEASVAAVQDPELRRSRSIKS